VKRSASQFDLDDLTSAEQEAAFDQLGSVFDNPSEDVRLRYAELGKREASFEAASVGARTFWRPQVQQAGA
jgi:hypothetical protein